MNQCEVSLKHANKEYFWLIQNNYLMMGLLLSKFKSNV